MGASAVKFKMSFFTNHLNISHIKNTKKQLEMSLGGRVLFDQAGGAVDQGWGRCEDGWWSLAGRGMEICRRSGVGYQGWGRTGPKRRRCRRRCRRFSGSRSTTGGGHGSFPLPAVWVQLLLFVGQKLGSLGVTLPILGRQALPSFAQKHTNSSAK